jgi:DNA-binding transcriptional MerR regulator
MDVAIPEKVYFRIGEVSKILGVEPYVVRYWESEFKSVRPVRSKSDRRLYRRKDLETLLTIKRLLYGEHFTISGAKLQLAKLTDEKTSGGVGEDRARLSEIKNALQQVREILR